ncbi:MAG TPA: ABC transporter permease [Acidimicrobiales bacterium]|nr:ABC transporter permease [Acidimicrobiales bacterium]
MAAVDLRPPAPSGFLWLRVHTIVRRLTYVVTRSPHRWFEVIVFPCIDVLLWGALGAYAQEGGAVGSGAPYLLAGIMLNHFLFQTEVSLATGFLEETWSRNVLNVMTTSVRELEYIVGIVLYGLGKLVVAIVTVNLCAWAMFDFTLLELGWGVVPLAVCLLIAGWAMGLFMIGLVLRFGHSAEILTWAMPFLVLALSGVFNPIRAIPGALQPLAQALPTTYAFDAGRSLLDGDGMPWADLARAGFGSLVLLVLAAWFARRMLATFRQRGYVTRYS